MSSRFDECRITELFESVGNYSAIDFVEEIYFSRVSQRKRLSINTLQHSFLLPLINVPLTFVGFYV